jgi:hypothetical protein
MVKGAREVRLQGRKFHPSCFTCQFCHKNMTQDYFDALDGVAEQKVHVLRGLPCCEIHWKAKSEAGIIDERGRLKPGAIAGKDEHEALKNARKQKKTTKQHA